MQSRNRLLDDLAKLATNAAGLAQGVRDEAENAVRAQIERIIASMDIVQREEFEALQEMARKTADENEELKARIEKLEAARSELEHARRTKQQRKGEDLGP